MKGDAVGIERGRALLNLFRDGAPRFLAEQVNPLAEAGHHDLDIVLVLSDQFPHREQDVFQVLGIGLVALIDDLVLRASLPVGVRVMGPGLVERKQSAGGTHPLDQASARLVDRLH